MPYAEPTAQREYQRKWAARRRAIFFRGKECERCGSRANLQLHHRDPRLKVAHAIWSWGEKRRQAEIAKCEVLCGDCHVDEHRPAMRELAAARTRDCAGRFASEGRTS